MGTVKVSVNGKPAGLMDNSLRTYRLEWSRLILVLGGTKADAAERIPTEVTATISS